MNKTLKIEITLSTVIKILALLGAIWLLVTLRNLVLLAFIAFIVSSAIMPVIKYLKKQGIPVWAAVLISYLTLLLILSFLVLLIAQPLYVQTREMIEALPAFMEEIFNDFPSLRERYEDMDWENAFEQLINFNQLGENLSTAFGILEAFFGVLITGLLVVMLSIYMLEERSKSKKEIWDLFPHPYRNMAENLVKKIEGQLGMWLRGQFILCLIIGVLSWIGFTVIGVKYALPLALLAGFLEAVPTIGPLVAGIVAIFITAGSVIVDQGENWWKIVLVCGWAILIQQFENYLLVPKVMEKVVGLSPIITTLSVLAGGQLLGLPGAVLAVPIAAVLQILFEYWVENRTKGKEMLS